MDNRILQSLDIQSGFVNKVPVKVMRDRLYYSFCQG